MIQKHTVLVVDDEADVLKSVQDLLRLNCRILCALGAQEGTKILRQEEVHVVMTDQRMPEMTGVEFCRRIRQEYPHIVRIIFTAHADIRAVIDAINQGNVFRYLIKPWDPRELEALVREACEHYDLAAESSKLLMESQGTQVRLKKAETELRGENAILRGMNTLFREALTAESEAEVAATCLRIAQEMTGSKFGYVGKVNATGRLDTIAISNPGWDACTIPQSEATRLLANMEIHGVDRGTIREGKSRIVNDPRSHPDSRGTPRGHPRITSFLGVPLKQGDRAIGMIGLANKDSGYDLADQQMVESLAVSFVAALLHKQAERELRTWHDRFKKMVEERTDSLAATNKQLQDAIAERKQAEEALRAILGRLPGSRA